MQKNGKMLKINIISILVKNQEINENKKNSDFKIGEIVVYPKHGVGEIAKIETMEISNIKTSFYVVKMEQSKLTIRVPLDKK